MFKRFVIRAFDLVKRFLTSNYLRTLGVIATVLCISLVLSISIKTSQNSIMSSQYTEDPRPVRSMVFVKRKNTINFVACLDQSSSGSICQAFGNPDLVAAVTQYFQGHFEYSITGSAAVISHDSSRDMSYVISAYHVCSDFSRRTVSIQITTPVKHTLIFEYIPQVVLTDFNGNEYAAEQVRMDRSSDLCVLGTDGIMSHTIPVQIAERGPQPGERIYNIASPHGLSRPGAVLSYEGYFAGAVAGNRTIHNPHYLFAIPTAPGSSGSIVLNSEGQIISVISYGFITRSQGPLPPHEMWPNASAGPSLNAIRDLIMARHIQ